VVRKKAMPRGLPMNDGGEKKINKELTPKNDVAVSKGCKGL
jgi:hypothetical protein